MCSDESLVRERVLTMLYIITQLLMYMSLTVSLYWKIYY